MTREEKQAEEQFAKIIDIKEMFETDKGQNILYHLCKHANYFASPSTLDPSVLAFEAGKRDVINYILAQLQQNPATLMQEFKKRQQEMMDYDV